MPVRVADIILSQCVLDQINFVLDFGGEHFWNDHDFTQLTQKMLAVGHAECWVVFVFFVHLKVFMSIADL